MPIQLSQISPSDIVRNPLNPREVFDPATMKLLKKSIEEVNILVPITVYQRNDGKYCLIDGERRWTCAKELGLEQIPAVVIPEPDPTTNLLQMFNIHHLRVQWKLIWTALKLETIMHNLKTEDPEKLAIYTGMSKRKIDHCKRILYFPKKYQTILLVPSKGEKITTDFFVELYPFLKSTKRDLPEILGRFKEEVIIDTLMKKFRSGDIKAAREFRVLNKMIESVQKGVNDKEKVISLFADLMSDPEMNIMQISRLLMLESPNLNEIRRSCEHLSNAFSALSRQQIEENTSLEKAMKQLSEELSRLSVEWREKPSRK